MGIFNNRFSRGRRSSSDRFSARRSDKPVSMHSAVCDACGKDCQVPFRPSGDKPIYCSDCFEKQGNGRSERSGRRDSRGSRDFNNRGEMYSAVCDDCGKDCQVPFRPSGDKPIYCSRCFENRGNSHKGESSRSNRGQNNDMLEAVNTKLDRILAILEAKTE